MTKTCVQSSTVGKTLKLTNEIDPNNPGNPPYDVTIKKNNNILQTFTKTETTTQTINYTLQQADGNLKIILSAITIDSNGKSATESCEVTVNPVITEDCPQLILKKGSFNIIGKGFMNNGVHVCGEISNFIIEPLSIWVKVDVISNSINLKLSTKLNYTNDSGTIQEIILEKTQTLMLGTHEIVMTGTQLYNLGQYNIMSVTGELI